MKSVGCVTLKQFNQNFLCGEVAERLNAPVLKTGEPLRVP